MLLPADLRQVEAPVSGTWHSAGSTSEVHLQPYANRSNELVALRGDCLNRTPGKCTEGTQPSCVEWSSLVFMLKCVLCSGGDGRLLS